MSELILSLSNAQKLLEQARAILLHLDQESKAPEMETVKNAGNQLETIIEAIDAVLIFEDDREGEEGESAS